MAGWKLIEWKGVATYRTIEHVSSSSTTFLDVILELAGIQGFEKLEATQQFARD